MVMISVTMVHLYACMHAGALTHACSPARTRSSVHALQHPSMHTLGTCGPGKKWVSGLQPEIIGQNRSRDRSQNWPRQEDRENKAQKQENPFFFSIFSLVFSWGPILGPILVAIFFLIRAGGLKPIFYQIGRFLVHALR